MQDEMPTFTTTELLELARSLRSELRRSGLDYRVPAAAHLVEELSAACAREGAGGGRITPILGGVDEPRCSERHLVAQL